LQSLVLKEKEGKNKAAISHEFEAQHTKEHKHVKLMISESLSGMCTKFHNVTASNNRDHMP